MVDSFFFFSSLMRSVSRHASSTKGSPTLQSSSSYINENSTESGFGSDIFDIGATDFNRHPSNIERVNISIFLNNKNKYFLFLEFFRTNY